MTTNNEKFFSVKKGRDELKSMLPTKYRGTVMSRINVGGYKHTIFRIKQNIANPYNDCPANYVQTLKTVLRILEDNEDLCVMSEEYFAYPKEERQRLEHIDTSEIMATDKQMNYLYKMGYEGGAMRRKTASYIIGELIKDSK